MADFRVSIHSGLGEIQRKQESAKTGRPEAGVRKGSTAFQDLVGESAERVAREPAPPASPRDPAPRPASLSSPSGPERSRPSNGRWPYNLSTPNKLMEMQIRTYGRENLSPRDVFGHSGGDEEGSL